MKRDLISLVVRLTNIDNRNCFDSFKGDIFGFWRFLTVLWGCLDSFDSFESGWRGCFDWFRQLLQGVFSVFCYF